MKKSLLSICLAIVIIFALSLPALAFSDIDIYINGDELALSVPPTVVDGTTLVPLRAIFEALGAQVDWQSETKTITATKKRETIILILNNRVAFKNGEAISLSVPPQIIADRTLVPLRFISESFACTVNWDPIQKRVDITTPDADTVYFNNTRIPAPENLFTGLSSYDVSDYDLIEDTTYYGYIVDGLDQDAEEIVLDYYYYLLDSGLYFAGLPAEEEGITYYTLISPDDRYVVLLWADTYKENRKTYHYLNIVIYPYEPVDDTEAV